MTEFLIGTGGWAYFHVPGLRSLEAYAQAFNFVEANSTFYQIPSLEMVKSWRRRVPADFEFSVRCHRSVTHKHQLKPVKEALDNFEIMLNICGLLRSRFLVLETPSSMDFSKDKIASIRDFFGSVKLDGVGLVCEVRGRTPMQPSLVELMNDYDIIHCVDLSREEPVKDSPVVYTRVFGKGKHNVYQFEDGELGQIDEKITRRNPQTVAVSFHNVRMYKDAARFKIFKETGKFPLVTGVTGQLSLRKVLMEDSHFPMTKRELVEKQGWKVIDLTEDKRVHARVLLENLPEKRFRDVDEVLVNLSEI